MNQLEEKLERIAEALELAKKLVCELEVGETVETVTDADYAIVHARHLAKNLLEELKEYE